MKYVKFFVIFFVAAAILCACSQKEVSDKNTVHLKGQLIDMGSQEVRMSYNGASSLLGNRRDILLKLDAQGNFDTTFVLEEPAYYNISRNTLYLSPGDELTVKITPDNEEAEFTGTSAGINTYMKGRLFPKGGSFLESGENITGNYPETKETLDSLAAIRLQQLDTLSNASPLFRKLEKARIQGDIANSYLSYWSYAQYLITSGALKTDIPEQKVFLESLTPDLKPILKEINDPVFLDVAVVRDVFSYAADSTFREMWFNDITLPERTQELYASAAQVQKLSADISQETTNEVSAFTSTLKNKDFADELNVKIAQATKLFPGQPAIDFQMEDLEGTITRLSDFKGKVIYIDLWATWCGPCLQESPFFEELATKYNPEEVLFLPVSIDSNKKEWLNYLSAHDKNLKQYYSSDKTIEKEWNVKSIPRFVLISKDFKIVNAYASRPSDKETESLLNTLINN